MNRRDFLKLIPAAIGAAFVAKIPKAFDTVAVTVANGSMRQYDDLGLSVNAMEHSRKFLEANKHWRIWLVNTATGEKVELTDYQERFTIRDE